jgi:glycosyltransferase involved in cell wall biosynthesis
MQTFGGQEVQMLQTKKYLQSLGVEVKLYDKFSDKISDFDIYHLFGSNSFENINMVNYIKRIGLKFVLSPVYWDPYEMSIMTETSRVKSLLNRPKYYIKKNIKLDLINPTTFYLNEADSILPNSILEAEHLIGRFKVDQQKIHVIYNGVEERFNSSNRSLFESTYHLNNFILFVGRIERKKNVLSLIKAMEGLPYDLVLIGSTSADPEYYNICLSCCGENIHFIENIDHNSELLQSAYSAAKLFVLPSWMETPGISALEAGLAGCKIIITDRGATKEYFKGFVRYCDPNNISSIHSAISEAMEEKDNIDKTNLAQYLMENFSWPAITRKIARIYENLLLK